MASAEIEEFGRILVQQVRDAAIQSCDMQLRAGVNTPMAKRWREAARTHSTEELATLLIPDVVDDTLFFLMRALDQDMLSMTYTAANGKIVNLSVDGGGELAGWFVGSDEWRARYSKERFVDDCADMGSL